MIVRTDHSRPPLQNAVVRNAAVNQYQRSVHQWSGTPQPISALRTPHSALRTSRAFTLLELLTVITIMGIIAALSVPTLRGLKPNAKVAATRQLLDAVGRARQLAISQRTTVYMVFLPTNFWSARCCRSTNDGATVQVAATSSSPGTPMSLCAASAISRACTIPLFVFVEDLAAGAFIPPAQIRGRRLRSC